MADSRFSIIIFTGRDPQSVARLAKRIQEETLGAQVRGVLYEQRPGKTPSQRIKAFARNLHDWEFVKYAAWKVTRAPLDACSRALGFLLRLAHACPQPPNPAPEFTLDDLRAHCDSIGGALHVTADTHSAGALDFARGCGADLGIVYGARILKPELFKIPRLGSINIHKRQVPDYRGGGPVGLWELLDDQKEIGVTVHRVEKEVDTGAVVRAATIPIEAFDGLTSLDLKADVVGDDLLVAAVSDFVTGNLRELPQQGQGRTFKGPKPQQLRQYQKQLRARRRRESIPAGYPVYKLLLRSLLLAPFLVCRNWLHYWRGSFPVVILFHHLASDRPHRLGMSTERFLKHIEFLKKHYHIAGLSEAIRMLQSNTVRQPTVALTFDDGYQENFLNLRALIQRTGVPVTLFVCTGHASTQLEFHHDVRKGERNFLPLTWDQIVALSRQGVEIGSHTRTHFDCGAVDAEALHGEIAGSKEDLESRLGRPVLCFSFPFGLLGNISKPALEIAKATYPYVFSAYGGANVAPKREKLWHLRRCPHPGGLWELELMLQSALQFRVEDAPSVVELAAAGAASAVTPFPASEVDPQIEPHSARTRSVAR